MALKLDSNGDLSRTGGRFDTLDETADRDAVIGQRIAVRLRRWAGEWSFDTRLGVPWETLLGKGVPLGKVRAEVVRQIQAVPGVRAIRQIELTPSGRNLTISGQVQAVASGELVTFATDVEV